MDRAIVYNGEQINASDIDYSNLFSMIGLGKLTKAILGAGPFINDLECIPDSPASLDVFLQPGEIYSLQNVDNTAYGDLPSDTTHQIVKQGILYSEQSFTITPPPTPGESINYLIQISYSDQDTDPENRPYFSGPPQVVDTIRRGLLVATLKPGNPATTGTQVTPAPDVGNIGAWVITVANAQTQIIAADINPYPAAPFISEKLSSKISQSFADARYGQITNIQSGGYIYGVDTGAVNAYVSLINPAIASYVTGLKVNIKISNMNTGASTLNLNVLGIKNIISQNGQPINPADLMPNMIAEFIYDGTSFRLSNPSKNLVAFRALLNSNASIPDSTPTQIVFDNAETNINNNFNPATGKFTVTIPGYYEITASLGYSGNANAGSELKCSISKNSLIVSQNDISAYDNAGPVFLSNPVSHFEGELLIGDIIEIIAFSSPAYTLTGNENTYFHGHRIY